MISSYLNSARARSELLPSIHCPSFRTAPGSCPGAFLFPLASAAGFLRFGRWVALSISNETPKSAGMKNDTDELLNSVFDRAKTIAVVGFSMNPARASHYVAQFLHEQGYRVIPVNPGHVGKEIFGTTIRASLADIDEPVDMVDVFRRSEALMAVVDDILENLPGVQTIWTQLGVIDAQAAEKAEAAGVTTIMNRCPKIEIPRLGRLR